VTLAERLGAATAGLLEALDDAARATATAEVGDPNRLEWAYWPTPRRGLPLHRLDRAGSKAVHRVLATLVPVPVLARVTTIMGLDEVLDRLEGHAGDRRHRDDYWTTVFGRPGDRAWAWRFEGHHVSIHATVVAGEVHLTPLFLGANPAVVGEAGRPVVAPLGVEEELGFELLHALTVEQRASALVAETAPDDIATRNDPAVDPDLVEGGLPLSSLAGGAAQAAGALLDLYLARFPAGARRPDPAGARFAWAGADAPGVGHYYRLAAPGLLVELDNTQDGANHVHTVVREPGGDLGGDALGSHHARAHRAT
jgi:hypothetical protein